MFKPDRENSAPRPRRALAFLSGGVIGLSVLLSLAPALAAARNQNGVTLCHQAGGAWNAITVDASGLGGHQNHDGDIIPAVGSYGGKNLATDFAGALGSAILANGCVAPVTPVVQSPSQDASPSQDVAASPSQDAAPSGDQAPSDQQSPSDESAPSQDQAPSDQQSPSDEQAPSQDQAPSGDQAPSQDEAPSDQQSPSDEPAPSQDQGPSDVQPPSQDEAPSDQQAPSQDEAPSDQQAPSQDEAPADGPSTPPDQGTENATTGNPDGGTLPNTALPRSTGLMAALGLLLLIAAHAGLRNHLHPRRS